jgi:hypothetical protein
MFLLLEKFCRILISSTRGRQVYLSMLMLLYANELLTITLGPLGSTANIVVYIVTFHCDGNVTCRHIVKKHVRYDQVGLN